MSISLRKMLSDDNQASADRLTAAGLKIVLFSHPTSPDNARFEVSVAGNWQPPDAPDVLAFEIKEQASSLDKAYSLAACRVGMNLGLW